MGNVEQNLIDFKKNIPPHVQLVVVSKTHPARVVMEAYRAGQRIFGENRVQELIAKQQELPSDIEWHLIGHLQTNKVKYIAPFVSLIHSVDSLKLLREINAQAQRNERVIDCLLQVHIAQEDTKYGLSSEEAIELLSSKDIADFQHVRFLGLMGMSTFTNNMAQVREEFQFLKSLFDRVKQQYGFLGQHFKELSMGMSSDYSIAIEEGSTMIRIGSAIFGEREY